MRIMIVEDDPISRSLLETFLTQWGYDVLVTEDGMEAWKIIRESRAPNLIISDWMMPNMDGLDLCKKIREMVKHDYTYFILLTTKSDREDIIEGLDAGADDFITKPFDHGELKSRVKIGERIINLERRVIEMANTDFLTGVLSRRAFIERAEEEISRSVRKKRGFSIIMIDIDHFKKINDSYGHQAGDRILQDFAGEVRGTIRVYDFVGRYGGEEFIVCLPDINMEQSLLSSERMRAAIEEIKFTLPDGDPFPIRITASFGVSCFHPDSGDDLASIIKRADEALYEAKSRGRNQVYGWN